MNLELFNPEQREAITLEHDYQKYKKILLIAGAGSGKTRVIVYRIAHLIQNCGVSPRQILALTFTKKAAKEMKGRTVGLLGSQMPVKMSTFHSLAAELLRNISNQPVDIIDDSDKDKILRMLIKERGLKDTLKLKNFKSWLDYQRNKCINPEVGLFNDNPTIETYRELAKAYRVAKSKISSGVYDFDDLLEKLIVMLEGSEKLRTMLHHRWRYMMVDEYQDTNKMQFKLLNLMTGDKTQLLQVGDEDQLIYSWRGAEIEHILNSYEDSKSEENTRCIVLNRNYRCSGNILELANKVVSQNVNRAGKELVANKKKGSPVLIKGYQSCSEEADDIALQLSRWHVKDIAYNDMAVLFRTNRMAKRVEAALISEGIPYKLHSGVAMFDTKESQLLLSLLRFTEQPGETFFLREIYAQIKYGLGPAAIEKEDKVRMAKSVDWITHLKSESGLMKKNRINELVSIYELAKDYLDKGDLVGAANTWYHHWDLMQFYKSDSRDSRDATIIEILGVIETYEHDCKLQEKKPTMIGFQEERLLNDTVLEGQVEDVVHLMTVHKAKGLEFKAGVVVGIQDGVFPMNPDEYGDEAEENFRLAYVAITRFMNELMLTRASYRIGFNDVSGYSSILDHHLNSLMKKGIVAYVE
jgi:DNA helicase-2/ATP-dependent DNA helicase PcrA